MSRWNYDVIEVTEEVKPADGGSPYPMPWTDVESVKAVLNRAGAEQWELVSVIPVADLGGTTRKVVLFLKRFEG